MGKTVEELKQELAELDGNGEKQETRTDGPDAKARAVFDYLKSGVIERRRKEWAEQENATFQVCPDCWKKNTKGNQTCDLCGKRPDKWMDPTSPGDLEPGNVAASARRASFIAAASTYTPDELNWYVAHSGSDIAFVKHCVRILELRGIPCVRSFWERSGFTISGEPKGSDQSGTREMLFHTDVYSPGF